MKGDCRGLCGDNIVVFSLDTFRQVEKNVVVVILNNTEIQTMYIPVKVLTNAPIFLVIFILPVCMMTAGGRHIQNLNGEVIFKSLAFYSQIRFLCFFPWLSMYKR
jgi:hypothetical protein